MKTLFTILFFLFAAPSFAASTYYISPTGKDSTCAAAKSMTSPAGPKMAFIFGCMVGGDTLIVNDGFYDEPLHKVGFNGFPPSGTAAAPTIIKAASGAKPWLRTVQNDPWGSIFEADGASYIIFDGIRWNGSIDAAKLPIPFEYVPFKFGKGHHIKILNGEAINLPDGWFTSNSGDSNEISKMIIHDSYKASSYNSGSTNCGQPTCWGYAFYWNGNNNIIKDNEIYNVPSWVVHLYCSGPAYCNNPNGTIVSGNKIHDYGYGDASRANGVLVSQGNANQVLSNAIWNGPAQTQPIAIGAAATNTIVKDNTFVAPAIIVPPAPTPTVAIDIKTTGAPQLTITVDGVKR